MNSETSESGDPSRSRFLSITGSHNLRDMGGYLADDGRHVRWLTLFRSGVMDRISDSDCAKIRRLGLAVIYDLRANHERARHPTRWHESDSIEYHSRDYEQSVGALDDLITLGGVGADAFTGLILEAYRELPFEQADSYRELFRLLIAGNVPLLFNCTAGKDRTGIAAALILSALGVSRETIELDYSLTDLVLDKLTAILTRDPRYAKLGARPREHYLPLLRADPEYLTVAFEEIERRHGTVTQYLDDVLGVGERETAALRDLLLI